MLHITLDLSQLSLVSEDLDVHSLDNELRIVSHPLQIGHWDDPDLLTGQTFNYLLLDYLIGSMDAFTPYAQVCCVSFNLQTDPLSFG